MPVAESILFAGKAIQVLRNPSPAVQFQGAPSQQHIQTMLTGEELLPQSEANKIESTLQNLQESSEFHKQSFETAVDTIKAIVADHLWQLVVLRADLNGHLKALKDYFLLAKDDFFQIFLEESLLLMQLPPCQLTAEADLMVLFQLASVKTIREEDKYFPRVSLGMPGITLKSSHIELPEAKPSFDGDSGVQSDTSMEMPVDGWDGITLEYCVEWPLHLFFTQMILSKYLRIFQYLLRLKRTRMDGEVVFFCNASRSFWFFHKSRRECSKFNISTATTTLNVAC